MRALSKAIAPTRRQTKWNASGLHYIWLNRLFMYLFHARASDKNRGRNCTLIVAVGISAYTTDARQFRQLLWMFFSSPLDWPLRTEASHILSSSLAVKLQCMKFRKWLRIHTRQIRPFSLQEGQTNGRRAFHTAPQINTISDDEFRKLFMRCEVADKIVRSIG